MKKLVVTLLAAALSLPMAFAAQGTPAGGSTQPDTEKHAKKAPKAKKTHKGHKAKSGSMETTAPPATN